MNRRDFLKTAAVAVPAAVVMPSLLTAAPTPEPVILPKVSFGLGGLDEVVSLKPGQLALVLGGRGCGKAYLMWSAAIFNSHHMNTAYVETGGYFRIYPRYGQELASDRLVVLTGQLDWAKYLDVMPPNTAVFVDDTNFFVRGEDRWDSKLFCDLRAKAVEKQLALVVCHTFDEEKTSAYGFMRPADLVLNVRIVREAYAANGCKEWFMTTIVKNRVGPSHQAFWYDPHHIELGQPVPCSFTTKSMKRLRPDT